MADIIGGVEFVLLIQATKLILQILIVFPLTPLVPGLVMMSEQKAVDRRKTLKDKIDQKQTVSVCEFL